MDDSHLPTAERDRRERVAGEVVRALTVGSTCFKLALDAARRTPPDSPTRDAADAFLNAVEDAEAKLVLALRAIENGRYGFLDAEKAWEQKQADVNAVAMNHFKGILP